MSEPDTSAGVASGQSYPCPGCGARVEYAIGTTLMECPYCGRRQQIQATGRQVREHPVGELASLPRKPVGAVAAHEMVCRQCGARTRSNELSGRCQFCDAPLQVDPAAVGQIVPEAVLPFTVDQDAMRKAMREWVRSRRFAPNALKKVATAESTKGTYLPYWTFDAATVSRYVGARGNHYYVTVSYTDSQGRTQTRMEQRTSWHSASGTVSRHFDDVLVPGTTQVPAKRQEELAPWPLAQAVPFQPQYLAGYHALCYDVEPEAGFESAKGIMAPAIVGDCKRDIGGDVQRVDHVDTRYSDLTYKLLLMPVWVAFYMFHGKRYQLFVNGRTGEIHGERPYSPVKIALAVLAALAVVAATVAAILYYQ